MFFECLLGVVWLFFEKNIWKKERFGREHEVHQSVVDDFLFVFFYFV